MGDNINVDWSLAGQQAAATGAMADAAQSGVDQGLDNYRKTAALKALQGADLSSPAGVQNALTGLVRAGATDQAAALSQLQFASSMRGAVPNAMASLFGQAAGADPSAGAPAAPMRPAAAAPPPAPGPAPAPSPADTSDLTPAAAAGAGAASPISASPMPAAQSPNAAEVQADAAGTATGQPGAAAAVGQVADAAQAHRAQTMQMGVQAVQKLQATPEADRPAVLANEVAPAMVARGVPAPAVQAMGADLSDAGLQRTGAFLQGHLDQHPAFGGSGLADGSAVPGASVGTQAWYRNLLQNPKSYQQVAMLKAAGLDFTPMMEAALRMQEPEIQQEALDAHEPARAAATEAMKGTVDAGLNLETHNVGGRDVTMTRAQWLDAANRAPGQLGGLTPGEATAQTEGARLTAQTMLGSQAAAAEEGGRLQAQAAGGEAASEAQETGRARGSIISTTVQGRPTMMTGGTFMDLQNRGTPGVGVGLTPGETTAQTADASDLQEQVKQAATRQGDLQKAQANGQQIMGLANAVGTGRYTPALSDLATRLPFGHTAQQYATNSALLGQDLSQSFRSQLDGISVPRLHSEADAITGAIPKLGSQPDQLRLYGASITAAANYRTRHDDFMTQYAAANPGGGLRGAQAAWASGPGKASYLADPVFRNMKMSNGQPAVVVDPKTRAGVFMPGTKQQFVFPAG